MNVTNAQCNALYRPQFWFLLLFKINQILSPEMWPHLIVLINYNKLHVNLISSLKVIFKNKRVDEKKKCYFNRSKLQRPRDRFVQKKKKIIEFTVLISTKFNVFWPNEGITKRKTKMILDGNLSNVCLDGDHH